MGDVSGEKLIKTDRPYIAAFIQHFRTEVVAPMVTSTITKFTENVATRPRSNRLMYLLL